MFCPKCKAEYVKGTRKCPDCKVTLVQELKQEAGAEFIDFVEIRRIGNQGESTFLKSVLDGYGIKHIFSVEPYANTGKLLVAASQAKEAKELLENV